MVMQLTVNQPPLARLVRSQYSPPNLVLKCSWTHTALSLPKSGDRYPLRPPSFSIISNKLFRKTRARCMGVTVNHWLVEFDSLMRSQSFIAGCDSTLWSHKPRWNKEHYLSPQPNRGALAMIDYSLFYYPHCSEKYKDKWSCLRILIQT